jgi:hypothetical protein
MTVEQTKVIDIVSLDGKTGKVILTVSDHLDWTDSAHHQEILQAKFNAYLAFVESGEMLKSYPDAVGRSIEFKVVFKSKPDHAGRGFLIEAQKIIESAGFSLRSEIFADSYDN